MKAVRFTDKHSRLSGQIKNYPDGHAQKLVDAGLAEFVGGEQETKALSGAEERKPAPKSAPKKPATKTTAKPAGK